MDCELLSHSQAVPRHGLAPSSELQITPIPPSLSFGLPLDYQQWTSRSQYLSLWSAKASYTTPSGNLTAHHHHRSPSKTLLYDLHPSYVWEHTPTFFPTLARPWPAVIHHHQEGHQTSSRDPTAATASIPVHPRNIPSVGTSMPVFSPSSVKPSMRYKPTNDLDVNNILERLLSGDCERAAEKNRLLSSRGPAARRILDALQSWLDTHLQHPERRKILRLLVDIAAASNELPRSLFLSGVLVESPRPVKYGGYADVFQGSLDGQPVAIKRLRFNDDEYGKIFKEFCKEGLVWRQLSHPNVLPFIGVDADSSEDNQTFAMVSPWMKRGTVMTYVRSSKYNPRLDRQRLIIEVAEGLLYLHRQGIAHGDLHGGNVLITDDGHACLTDFGMTVIGDLSRSHHPSSRGSAGVNRWLAPEVFLPDPVLSRKTLAGDVFSFGRICLAICTTRPPFPETPDRCMYHLIYHDERPSRPTEAECGGIVMSDVLWSLANACWEMDPAKRPRMDAVRLSLGFH